MINFFVVYTYITPLSTDVNKIKIEQPGDRRGFGHVERGQCKGSGQVIQWNEIFFERAFMILTHLT